MTLMERITSALVTIAVLGIVVTNLLLFPRMKPGNPVFKRSIPYNKTVYKSIGTSDTAMAKTLNEAPKQNIPPKYEPPKQFEASKPNIVAKPFVQQKPYEVPKPNIPPKPYVPPKPYEAPRPNIPAQSSNMIPPPRQPQLNDPRKYYAVKERLALEPNRLYFNGKQNAAPQQNIPPRANVAMAPKQNMMPKQAAYPPRQNVAPNPAVNAPKLNPNPQQQFAPNPNAKPYDVVLTSYMRSGSTLTGIVLGHRSDCFYVYEPLWKVARWAYWRGNDSICRTDNTDCRWTSPDTRADPTFMDNQIPSYTASLNEAKQILTDIYDCNFADFNRQVFSKQISMKLGGPAWDPIKTCLDRGEDQAACVNRYGPMICNRARHRVTKVLRLTPDQIEYLLQTRENIKVIHLYRDPRAIMNSRIETKWYPSDDVSLLLHNAESLCKKMIYDHQKGVELFKKYPDRFRFVYYEDLNDNPLYKAKSIYNWLGMDLDESKYTVLKDISVFKEAAKGGASNDRTKNTAFWWRRTLDWEIIKRIDTICWQVYDALGYVQFKTHRDLRNLELPSVNIPPEYLI